VEAPRACGVFVFEDFLEKAIDDIVPSGMSHIGFIAGGEDGRFVLSRSPNNKWGTNATFAKERVRDSERPSQTLRRCIEQYGTQHVESVYPVPLAGATAQSTTFYFAGLISTGEQYWQGKNGTFRWEEAERLVQYLNDSKNPASKHRDLAVLNVASTMCLSPHRRVLLML
jgi:hypothetical protein